MNTRELRNDRCAGSSHPDRRQRFLAVHSQVHNLFRVGRHLLRVANYQLLRNQSFETWQQVSCVC
jgi:hypothetical protein